MEGPYTQYGKFPSTTLDTLPHRCTQLGTSLSQVLVHDCTELAHKKLHLIYWVCLRKIFDLFELVGQFCSPLPPTFFDFIVVFPTFLILLTFLGLFDHFVPFWTSFTSDVHPDPPVCWEFHGTDHWCAEFSASHIMPGTPPPKFSAQSCYYVGHIQHGMCFSSLTVGEDEKEKMWGRTGRYTWGSSDPALKWVSSGRGQFMAGQPKSNLLK